MPVPILQVDAFAAGPFTGNPAAVCPMDAEPSATWMQAVALEKNLSETAFTWPLATEQGERLRLRWFTPAAEVDLCGHATLATAHALWSTGRAAAAVLRFETRGGELTCRRLADGRIEMDFPARPPAPAEAPAGLAAILGNEPRWFGTNGMDGLAELADEAAVRALTPDLAALARLDLRGLIVTAPAAPGADHDFVSRFFAPAVGVPEDPVTGSAHCALGPFWAARMKRARLTGWQASARGGAVEVEVQPRAERVLLRGRAVTTIEGTLLVGPDEA